jgi:hypothetical protein
MIGSFDRNMGLPYDITVHTMCRFSDALSARFCEDTVARLVHAVNQGVLYHCRIGTAANG